MRNTIDSNEIFPGKKRFFWEGYCLKLDNRRSELNSEYDPKNLTPAQDRKDWENFIKYYKEFENAG